MALACASCGAEHSAGARFCSVCGAPLRQKCPGCGSDQPADARFCSACGIALQEDAGRAADATDDRQERRVVTVVFADLAGSTALGEMLDPEDVRELQGELFDLINTEVVRFGGTSEKFAGDSVLAVFGIPQAHEDDPERAVRAGLALRDRFGEFTARVRGRHGASVGLRVGVNTGEVIAGREAAARGDVMVSGDAVNVAARLQQHAEPGEVLVGQRTHAATGRTIVYREHEKIEAKGKREPVTAWAAIAVADGVDPRARGVAGVTAPLVGRTEELAVLGAVASRATREKTPQFVTVFGPAGVGKTRLIAEFVQRLPAARVLKGRCLPYGEGIAYWPLAEVAKAHAEILDTDSTDAAIAKLRAAIEAVVSDEHAARVFEAVAWTIGFSVPGVPVMDADPRDVVRRLEDGWARYIGALGRDQLTIVAVEDVHWAPGPLLDLLERLAEGLADTRVLLVFTARLELLETRPTWGAGKQNATTLSLTPLSADEASELVSSLLGEASVPDDVRERVLANAEGNPFFLEEMLNMLIEDGALERQNGRWTSTERIADISVPDSIQGVIAARIDLLEGNAREALRRCSVIGRTFWPSAVGVDEREIASLTRTGLVAGHESVMAGMREFSFKHALTRDVVYATLPRPERRELHRRVAEWIQEVGPDRGVEKAELAAYHYCQALAYGEDDQSVALRAFELLMTASEAALSRAAFDAARSQLESALELATTDVQRVTAGLVLARLDYLEGWHENALEALGRLDALLQPSDAGLRSDVLGWRSRVSWTTGRWDEALSSANAAVAALDGLPESPQLARALARRSQIEMLKGRPEAFDHAEEAIAVAVRVGDSFAEVNARINRFTVRASSGVPPDPDELLEIVQAADEAGVPEEAFRAIVNFIWSSGGYFPLDRIELVADEARRRTQVALPQSIGPYLELSHVMMLVLPAARWEEADAILAGIDESMEMATSKLVWLGLAAGLALRRGEVETVRPLVEELRETALASGESQRIVPMACIALPWAFLAGEREELRSLADQVLTVLDAEWSTVLTAVPAIRALAAAGETDLLRQISESMKRTPSEAMKGKLQTSVTVAEGLIDLLEGRAEDAVARLTEAVEQERELGYVYDTACLERDLARALDAAGATAEAAEVQARSAAVLEPLGCVHPF